MKVEVYYNLHRKCLSVRSRTQPTYGRVIAHVDAICLHRATFHVSELGRQRVLKEKRKNVHAVVRGEVDADWLRAVRGGADLYPTLITVDADRLVTATYNPYKFTQFVNTADYSEPIHSAELVLIEGRKITACNPGE